MSKKINIRPTTGVYATYKNISYDPWTAIAEFVDNSTQSFYDNKKKLADTKFWKGLNVDITYLEEPEIGLSLTITDNAYGMDYRDFQRAIILDSPPQKATRSEFGMGLKTAACWFGTMWSVETTELGSGIKYRTVVDVDSLHKYKNEEIEVEEIPCSKKDHGTTIKIWNLNRKIAGRQVAKTKDQLRGMYRSDLRSGDVHISYNGEQLKFETPKCYKEELPNGETKTWKKEINFSINQDGIEYSVSGFVGILETASTSGAGFTLIRRGRVIIGGYENGYRPEEIFGKSNTFKYQRIIGELNMNTWPVTQTKDAFDWYSGLEDQLIENLKEQCKDYCDKAEKIRKRNKVAPETSIESMLDDFEKSGVIEYPSTEPLPINEYKSNNLSDKFLPDTPTLEEELNAIEVIGDKGRRMTFVYNGTGYTVDFILRSDNPKAQWLMVNYENDIYEVMWNIRHPFFRPFIDDAKFLNLLQKMTFALILSEIESRKTATNGKIDPCEIRLKMNDTLKTVVATEGADYEQ